jgi:uncharacterized membrane protein YphA (DoxX/SURF4 family)
VISSILCGARTIATLPAVRFVALLGLCAAYLQGGIDKLLDFPGAVAEVQHFGLAPTLPIAVASIVTEFAGPALILSGRLRWLGALWLAGFTAVATIVANRFWELPVPDRQMAANGFFEHLGLVGGFLLVAWYDLRRSEPGIPRS